MKICVIAPLNQTGVGTFAQYFIHAMMQECRSKNIELFYHNPTTSPPSMSINAMFSNELAALLMKDPSTEQYDVAIHIVLPQSFTKCVNARRHVLYTFFETSRLTPEQVQKSMEADSIVLTSKTLADLAKQHYEISNKVTVIPGGVRTLVPHSPASDVHRGTLKVVHVGKWEKRKCQIYLPQILDNVIRNPFYGWFGGEPHLRFSRAKLIGLWDNPWDRSGIEKGLRSIGAINNHNIDWFDGAGPLTPVTPIETTLKRWEYGRCSIELGDRLPNEQDVQRIMSEAHLAIYMHRGEGWCMPAIESMALGVPTLCSEIAGCDEYVSDYQKFLRDEATIQDDVDFIRRLFMSNTEMSPYRNPIEPADDGIFFSWAKHGNWWSINPTSLISNLVFAIPKLTPTNRDLCRRAGKKIEEKYSWNNCTKTFIERFLNENHAPTN